MVITDYANSGLPHVQTQFSILYTWDKKIIKDISYSPKVPKRKKTKIKISDFIVKHQYSNNEKN